MESEELLQLITHGREERNLEFKGRVSWNDINVKSKITKTILAMSNLRDGGIIIAGVEQKDEKFIPVGLEENMINTFKQDDISSYVNEFADPFVEITISHEEYESKKYVIIQIKEFNEIPIICKRDGENNLRRGAIYIRPRRKIESVEVPSQAEMREILDIATEKVLRKFKRTLLITGMEEEPVEASKQKFDAQLGDL